MRIDYNFGITLPDAQISVFITLFVPMKTLSNDILSSNYYVTRDSGCIVWRSWFLLCNLRFSEQGLGEWGLGSALLSDSAFLESSL